MSLPAAIQRAGVWRGGDLATAARPTLATGFPQLDALLPGGGWPTGALTELLYAHSGIGVLRLLTPVLSRLTETDRWIALVDPPHLPYAPALARWGIELERLLLIRSPLVGGLWPLEQSLRSGACAAVLAWPESLRTKSLRRLQLAAETGSSAGFLFRPLACHGQPSTATLRLAIGAADAGLEVTVKKRRGGWHAPRQCHIDFAGEI